MHGGGSGNEHSLGIERVCSDTDARISCKLEPLRRRQRGEGVSSRLSPSWNVEALRRLDCHGDGSDDVNREEWDSVMLSADLEIYNIIIN